MKALIPSTLSFVECLHDVGPKKGIISTKTEESFFGRQNESKGSVGFSSNCTIAGFQIN